MSEEADIVAILPFQRIDEKEIDAGLERALAGLAPDVKRIRYSVQDDWSGDPALYFRVLLSDDAVPNGKDWKLSAKHLSELTKRIRARVLAEIKPDQWGLLSYFNFRTVSEQADLKDQAWD